MSATLVRVACSVGSHLRVPLAGVALALLVTSTPASASPIRMPRHVVRAQGLDANQLYFERALAAHSLHVRVPRSLLRLQAVNGVLPNTPFVDYLRWRWSLNPARFARFHPRTAQLLSIDKQVQQTVTQFQLPPAVIPPTQINPSPEHLIPPPNTPEPATGLMAVLMAGAVWWVRRHRRQPAR